MGGESKTGVLTKSTRERRVMVDQIYVFAVESTPEKGFSVNNEPSHD